MVRRLPGYEMLGAMHPRYRDQDVPGELPALYQDFPTMRAFLGARGPSALIQNETHDEREVREFDWDLTACASRQHEAMRGVVPHVRREHAEVAIARAEGRQAEAGADRADPRLAHAAWCEMERDRVRADVDGLFRTYVMPQQ